MFAGEWNPDSKEVVDTRVPGRFRASRKLQANIVLSETENTYFFWEMLIH